MTDETELTGSPETFDLLGAIEGTTYPEVDVPFYFDAESALLISNMNKELQKLAALGRIEQYEALEPVFFEAVEALKDSQFTFTLKSVPRKVKKAWVAKAQAKFPDKQADALGNVQPNIEGFQYVELLQWQSYLIKITDPTGKVSLGPFPEATVSKLMDEAPEASLQAVSEAISELDEGVKSGYEVAVRNLDFSSAPSPAAQPDDTPQPSE